MRGREGRSSVRLASVWTVIGSIAAIVPIFIAVTTWFLVSDSGRDKADEAEALLRFPLSQASVAGKPVFKPWPELVTTSNLVVIATVSEQTEYIRAPAGNPDLTAVQ